MITLNTTIYLVPTILGIIMIVIGSFLWRDAIRRWNKVFECRDPVWMCLHKANKDVGEWYLKNIQRYTMKEVKNYIRYLFTFGEWEGHPEETIRNQLSACSKDMILVDVKRFWFTNKYKITFKTKRAGCLIGKRGETINGFVKIMKDQKYDVKVYIKELSFKEIWS